MEMYHHDYFMEDLLALRRESWDCINNNIPSLSPEEENHDFFFSSNDNINPFEFDSFYDDPNSLANFFPDSSNPSHQFLLPHHDQTSFNEIYTSLLHEFSTTTPHNNYNNINTPPFLGQNDNKPLSSMEGFFGEELEIHQGMDLKTTCKIEPTPSSSHSHSHDETTQLFNMGSSSSLSLSSGLEKKNRSKRIQGQPSKNLMAERRRRKRLNDRLSMLRSIVPKISKMDRTSILGDTIDYMKELLEKIKSLQRDIEVDSSNMVSIFKDVKPNDIVVRNSPKFDVERRNVETRVEICCGGKPGLLVSTLNTLEDLGLEIQQCVISCFNDFAMQASCSEELKQGTMMSSEDIKQALFRSAGYGGRCL